MISNPISIIRFNWIEINLNGDSKFIRKAIFLKFIVWDYFIMSREFMDHKITMKEYWGIAGIATTMPRILPR